MNKEVFDRWLAIANHQGIKVTKGKRVLAVDWPKSFTHYCFDQKGLAVMGDALDKVLSRADEIENGLPNESSTDCLLVAACIELDLV